MPLATPPTTENLARHPVVSPDTWHQARLALLAEEKEVTRQLDRLSAMRRALPWVRVEKEYRFATPTGTQTLADLFDGRSQLIVYHFMLGPGWDEGCDGCSFLSDHFDGPNQHLPHHDVTLLAVSRAPLPEILTFKKRMGWHFPWVSSHGSDFNYDYHVSHTPEQLASGKLLYNFSPVDGHELGEEHHGVSVFYRNPQSDIFHTYSCYSRGVDILCGALALLDLTPKGRNEQGTMDWVRLHDRYTESKARTCCTSH